MCGPAGQLGGEGSACRSVRHYAYTTCSQFSLCPKSPGWDVVLAPVCKPHCCWPSLRAPCSWKRCSWQCAEVCLQTPQQQKSITCYVQNHGENPFVLGQFTFWRLQFPSKFVLHQKFNFTHLFYFKTGRKHSKTGVSFYSAALWPPLSSDVKCTWSLLHQTWAFASFCRQKWERNPY